MKVIKEKMHNALSISHPTNSEAGIYSCILILILFHSSIKSPRHLQQALKVLMKNPKTMLKKKHNIKPSSGEVGG